jgi:hypothetical protein
MVDKINSLLKPTADIQTQPSIPTQSIKDTDINKIQTPIVEERTKIDLNKMESLLNGFVG